MRDSLEEERRAAILKRVECELELGRHADLVGELHQLLAQYPLDETLIAHQMTALYRSGRPADALSLYRETRTPPGRGAGRRARADCWPGCISASWAATPSWRSRPAHARARAGPAAPDTLPPETAEFVGRDDELALLTGEHGDSPPGQRHRGHARRGQDRAGACTRPAWSPGSTRTGCSTSTCTPTTRAAPRSTRAEALHRLLADAVRAGRADTRKRSASAPHCGGPS